ncbi:15-hydroxyprostaglandin dehydrogenase [Trichonephila clavipes]|uniref:15-hydroxyprostaglandin dehydrogenase n=1 Tax=Trichonephila clavipes TaxID=2585209 RepID=A0A8X6S0E7_TRICX|nr:15-hydroxyprostaglandin dehydrogenase [Trichonephila clavipes]
MHGTLTGHCYVDDILRPHVGPFINGLPGAIFQQDNARPHTARVAQDFLQADELTNLEQPTLYHVRSDTMASSVLADLTRALQGTIRGSGPAMKESENDVRSLEQLLMYVDEHYLAGKLPLGDHLGKVLHGVEEYHQRNSCPLRFHASQLKWTGYHRLWSPRPLHQLCGQFDVKQWRGEL